MADSEKKEQNKTTLITARALAELLSTSVRTVWRLRSAGKLPRPLTIGGGVRWIESEISAWIRAGAPDRKMWNSIKEAKNGSD